MQDIHSSGPSEEPEALQPLFYPSRKLSVFAPFRWLRLGWGDLRQAPRVSLAYGAFLTLTLDGLVWLAWDGENTVVLFALAVALILAGPVLAFGLYSISRQLERGQVPRLGVCWRESRHQLRNEMLFALVILVVLLVWARAASMVHIFLPISDDMAWHDWAQFFGVGSLVGAVFAGVVFCASVVSLPMMLDLDVDAITGALTSIAAVMHNKAVMLLWAGLIGLMMLLGFATALLGFVVILPLIGHASWHAYKDTVRVPATTPAEDPGLC